MSNTEKTPEIAASKAGMDVKTARKYLRARVLPSEQKANRHWRTHKDEFADVWPELKEQLSANPGLEAKTIFAALQRKYPERFADGQLRTLQRKVKHWRETLARNRGAAGLPFGGVPRASTCATGQMLRLHEKR